MFCHEGSHVPRDAGITSSWWWRYFVKLHQFSFDYYYSIVWLMRDSFIHAKTWWRHDLQYKYKHLDCAHMSDNGLWVFIHKALPCCLHATCAPPLFFPCKINQNPPKSSEAESWLCCVSKNNMSYLAAVAVEHEGSVWRFIACATRSTTHSHPPI